jgi:hypothetical protein
MTSGFLKKYDTYPSPPLDVVCSILVSSWTVFEASAKELPTSARRAVIMNLICSQSVEWLRVIVWHLGFWRRAIRVLG